MVREPDRPKRLGISRVLAHALSGHTLNDTRCPYFYPEMH